MAGERFEFALKLEPCYDSSMTKHKENILRLRAEGKSYREIMKELGCSSSTVSFHLGEGQKEKTRIRRMKVADLPFKKKVDNWKAQREVKIKEFQKSPKTHDWKMREKVRRFQMKDKSDTSPILDWTYNDVKEKIKDFTSCYLTGRPIDVNDYTTFQFDHIEPRAAGGDNSLDNLGVVTKEANYAKRDMPLEDFLALCLDVVIHWELVDEDDVKI